MNVKGGEIIVIKNENYNIYVWKDGINDEVIATASTSKEAIEMVDDLTAKTGQHIYYSYNKNEEELNKWWEQNYKRALNYVEKEKPSKVIKVFGGNGAREFYNTSTTKKIATELLNYLGPEEFEEVLDDFEKGQH